MQLFATSNHHFNCIRIILKGQFLRAKKNCSREVDSISECSILEERFTEKGYKREWVMETRNLACKVDREQLLTKTNLFGPLPYRFNFDTTYIPAAYRIRNIIHVLVEII